MPETRKIIRNVYILACDDVGSGGIGTVTIRNDRITSVSYGRSREDVPAPDVEVVDGTGKVLLPGFVDLHVHGESVVLDLLTAGEPQSRWQRLPEYRDAEAFWYQRARIEDWRRLYTTVCFMALRSGVTFLGEFGVPGGDEACSAALDAFTRTELPGMLTLHNADQIERVQQSRIKSLIYSLALPPAEELTTYNLQASLRLSRDSGYPIMVHMSDAERDMDVMMRNFGKSPIQVLDEFSLLDAGCLLVHMHLRDPKDLQRVSQRRLVPIVSPGGAMRKGFTAPPMAAYRAQQIPTAVSTDWGPFSHWAVLRSMLERDVVDRNQASSALEYLRDCTIRPATAVGIADEIGSIVAGKKANLQMIRCRSLDLQASLDSLAPEALAQALVQRVSTSDVSDVMVNGEFSIREGTVLTYSEEDIVRDIRDLLAIPHRSPLTAEPQDSPYSDPPLPPEPDGLGEEGFRIIRRSEEESPVANILRLDPDREPKKELPKKVRRIFGEDDL